MVAAGLSEIDLNDIELLFIDNVGNLVCTASYRLGERLRLVVLSITEGDEKIVKYPPMFQRADAIVFNKIDLLPHTDFDVQRAREDALHLKSDLDFFELSARTGEGVTELADWLVNKRQEWLTRTG
jgi:hydrogenase nickel incorporation protein HypB